jgi:hypothetical protein
VIVVACLNPALDITHEVAAMDWAGINRPAATSAAPVAGEFRSCDYIGALAAVMVEKVSVEEVG